MALIPPNFQPTGITTSQIANGAITAASVSTSNGFYASSNNYGTVVIDPNGKITADTLILDGQDIGKTLAKIQDRLAILVPDPKRLEKYEALRQAYEHYKTLEALCMEEENGRL